MIRLTTANNKLDPISAFLKQNLPPYISVNMFYMAATCLLVVVCVLIINNMLGKKNNHMARRIKAIHNRRKGLYKDEVAVKKRKKPETSINFMRKVSLKFELVKKLELQQSEDMLVQAGFRSKDAVPIFAFIALVLPVVLGASGLIAMKLLGTATFKAKMLGYAMPVLGLYLGLKLPWMALKYIRNKRYISIQRALSDTLDLLTVCAEAGLSVPAAMERVSRELGAAYPEMAEELALTALEISFYPDRNKALNNFVARCETKEIRGIVTVLIQTEKYGTPIAQALRVLSSEFRQARMLRAENKAARLPAMMTLPMIIFILPTVFIVILAPAIITGKKNFATQETSPKR